MKTSLLFTFALLIFTCSAAVPLSWTVETSRVQPAVFEAYQGETLTFEAVLQSYGKPITNALQDVRIYWQTNGMSSAYWSASASADGNILRATWTPSMDVGARVYNCFIGSPSNIYHAAFQLRLRPSPGATPNALPLPTPVIDFDRVRVLNPPWGSGGGGGCDTNAVDALANSAVVTNALTVATTNRIAALETATNNLSSSVSGLASSKADKAAPSADGNLASLTADGNLADSGKTVDDFLPSEGDVSVDGSITSRSSINFIFFPRIGVNSSGDYAGIYVSSFSEIKIGSVEFPTGEEPDLQDALDLKADRSMISATDPTFSSAVLAVGLNIDDETLQWLKDIGAIAGSTTGQVGIGTLLAALLAALMWLKNNKVGSFKSVGGASATIENGVAKLDNFFTESNSLLTGTIDDRLPIPISAKSAGFTTESYKRFVVTVSGDMTVTLHTPTSGDAEIFECRFNGASLSADASITFAGATATTMDANCGTVTAGKVALMSAFWNGTTWDVNWKVEG